MFHVATAAAEAYAFTQGVHAAVWANVTVRIVVAGLFAYYGTRETHRSRAAA